MGNETTVENIVFLVNLEEFEGRTRAEAHFLCFSVVDILGLRECWWMDSLILGVPAHFQFVRRRKWVIWVEGWVVGWE